MFCSECGAKNPDGSTFCQECGAKLDVTKTVKEEPKKVEKVTTSKIVNKMTKKQKSLIILVAIVIIVLFVLYQVMSAKAKPTSIVKDCMEALSNNDYHTLYELAGFSGDTTFMTEEAFTDVVKGTFENVTIQNYTVAKNATLQNAGLKATVPVNITAAYKTSSATEEVTIELSKLPNKKFLFFDNWKVEGLASILGYDIVENFKIIVPKDTKVTFEGVSLDGKYLDRESEEASETRDVYKIPQVFKTSNAKAEFELFGDIKVSKEIPISSSYYTQYTLSITGEDLGDAEKGKIKSAIQENMTQVMNELLAKKSYDEMKGIFAEGNTDSSKDIKRVYENQLNYLNRLNYTVSDFKVKDIEMSNIYIDSNFTISVRIDMDYSWKATSTQNGNSQDVDNSVYTTVELVYKDGYKVSDLAGLPSIYVYMY